MTDPDESPQARGLPVSVVVPVGGVDHWLDEAIESVLAQDGVELELIAVFNNGAKVPTGWPHLADPRVRVLYTPDSLGPAGAGQWGIDEANGDYIACLDADDVALPGRLCTQYQWLERHPETVLVSSQVAWIDDDGERVGAFALPESEDVREHLLKLNVAPHSSWMMRRAAVRKVGGYELSLRQMEDYELLLRLGILGPIAVLGETLTEYRLHRDQMSRAVRPTGEYVRCIARGRKALGQKIGASPTRVFLDRCWWEAQQWIMFLGRRIRG